MDANVANVTSARLIYERLSPPFTLTANTPYAISVTQTTANAVLGTYLDVPNANYFKPDGP